MGAGPALPKLPQLRLPQLCFFCKAGRDAASIMRFPRNRESSRGAVEVRGTQLSNGRKAGAALVVMVT
jgi:hypothetical protein